MGSWHSGETVIKQSEGPEKDKKLKIL